MVKYLLGTILGLCSILSIVIWQYCLVDEKWKTAAANEKAYAEELSVAGSKSVALQFTVDQLEYFNDSIMKALNETRNELKIKDKNLKALQYVASDFERTDTITINDTIFKDPQFSLDTLIGDDWYNLSLYLKYPSNIIVLPKFKSEKYIVVSTKKETVNPPKKIFFLRWFQKKHKILQVDVVEKSPYIEQQKSKYIEILK